MIPSIRFIGAYINVAANGMFSHRIFHPSINSYPPLSVLYLFESCITLSQEVDVIWNSRKWSAMTWLYACTRYAPFLLSVFELVPPWNQAVGHFTFSSRIMLIDSIIQSCVGVSVITGALSLIQFICFACKSPYLRS